MERSFPSSKKHTFERRNACGEPYETSISTSISELVLSKVSMTNEPVAYVSFPKKARFGEKGRLNSIFVLYKEELDAASND